MLSNSSILLNAPLAYHVSTQGKKVMFTYIFNVLQLAQMITLKIVGGIQKFPNKEKMSTFLILRNDFLLLLLLRFPRGK